MHHTSSPIDREPIDDSHRLALAAELAGELDVERRIRRDRWSDVYVARDVVHARPVAIRVLHEIVDVEERGHVERTMHVLARLHHPNVVGVYESRWLRDGRLAVVLQWVDGACLRDVLDDEPLTRECMVEVLHDIARALRVAQSRARALGISPGLVHRAVAPEHVLLDLATGTALLDPSLAMLGLADAEPDCLAPELLAHRPPTPRTDVYTLAVLGWEMLTGTSPCAEPSPDGTASADGAADGAEAMLWRGMQRNAAWRWATVDELLSALQPRSVSAGPAPEPPEELADPSAAPAPPEIDAERPEPDWEEAERVVAERAAAERADTEQDAFEQERRARQEIEREEAERAKAESAQALLARWSEETASSAPPGEGVDGQGSVLFRDPTGQAPGVGERTLAGAGLLGRARAHPALAPALVVSVLSIVALGGLLLWGPRTSASAPASRPPRTAVRGPASGSSPARSDRSTPSAAPSVAPSVAAARPTAGAGAVRPAVTTPPVGAPRPANRVTVAAIGGEPVFGAVPRPTAPSAGSAGAAPASPGVLGALFARVRRAVERTESAVAVAPAAAAGPAVDSLPANEPRPRVMWGAWHHSDGSRTYARPRFSDVLTLRLNPDGSAMLDERRYTLQRNGAWTVAAVVHQGSWDVRKPALAGNLLCVRWRTPSVTTACEPVSVIHDTIPMGPLLTFAGRHWRAGPPPSELTDHPPTRSRSKARGHSRR